ARAARRRCRSGLKRRWRPSTNSRASSVRTSVWRPSTGARTSSPLTDTDPTLVLVSVVVALAPFRTGAIRDFRGAQVGEAARRLGSLLPLDRLEVEGGN